MLDYSLPMMKISRFVSSMRSTYHGKCTEVPAERSHGLQARYHFVRDAALDFLWHLRLEGVTSQQPPPMSCVILVSGQRQPNNGVPELAMASNQKHCVCKRLGASFQHRLVTEWPGLRSIHLQVTSSKAPTVLSALGIDFRRMVCLLLESTTPIRKHM